jgi:hypothetical protein
MNACWIPESFQRRDATPPHHLRLLDARLLGHAIHEHRAGAADADVAAILRRREAAFLT